MKAVGLKTEYLANPIGIDFSTPRLFWNCEGGARQTAYRIVAERAGVTIWDTGSVESQCMTHIPYQGAVLHSRDIVYWRVKLWDENGTEGGWSDAAAFEMGLLNPSDWQASWIAGDYRPSKRQRYPVDCFRRIFRAEKPIVRARLYCSACGIYEAALNGSKVGAQRFSPGFTDYRKRVQYQTYDVTRQIQAGENLLEIELADGWYRGGIGAFGVTYYYGMQTKLLCQLELTYVGGSSQSILSDGSFEWSNDGPVRFADLKDGETVEAARTPGYSGKARLSSHPVAPTASNSVPMEEHEQFKPVLLKTPSAQTVLDFGQNIAGVIRFSLRAKAGQKVNLRFGETLDKTGEFTQSNIQLRKKNPTPKQEVQYTCRDGINEYQCRFAVFGFRYMLVQADMEFQPDDFTAIAVYSSMEEAGTFECSNALVNRFVENTLWSMKGNFLDIPTDCPTRERAGWTGDAQIFFTTGSYLMGTAPFFRKWLQDVTDRQGRNGKVHCIVPSVGNELYISRMDGCVGWADAIVYIPYRYWKQFGDRQILEEFYPAMRRYAKFMIGRTNRTGLWGKPVKGPDKKYAYNAGQAFGEWLEPKDIHVESIWDLARPRPEEGTAYLSHTMALLCEIADKLGRSGDAKLYAQYRDGAKQAYNHLFVRNGKIDTDRQSKLVRPLAFNLLEGEAEKNVLERLLGSIRNRNYRIGTGFLSTPLILPLLTQTGNLETAYRILEQEELPGWLYEPKHGATTVWEDWEGNASQNHYSPGSVCEWLFSTVCGIRLCDEANTFVIAPKPGGTLTYAFASYQSVYGAVTCGWKKNPEGGYTIEVSVPANTTATVILPDRSSQIVESGRHSCTCP